MSPKKREKMQDLFGNQETLSDGQAISFPVSVPYQVRADLYRLNTVVFERHERNHFTFDAQSPAFARAKLKQLIQHKDRVFCLKPELDKEQLHRALWPILQLVAQEQPQLAHLDGDRITLSELCAQISPQGEFLMLKPKNEFSAQAQRWLQSQPPATQLAHALALSVPEDYVLMDCEGTAALLHVAFPSRWAPSEKLGLSLAAIHAPVARNEQLIRASENLTRAMLERGPFVRFIWTLSTDPELSQHPLEPATLTAENVLKNPQTIGSNVYWRLERQTTLGLDGWALFTIRVYVTRLEDVVFNPERRQRLADALESMHPETLSYKGLDTLRDPVVAWLRTIS